jgi:hypothetical protein
MPHQSSSLRTWTNVHETRLLQCFGLIAWVPIQVRVLVAVLHDRSTETVRLNSVVVEPEITGLPYDACDEAHAARIVTIASKLTNPSRNPKERKFARHFSGLQERSDGGHPRTRAVTRRRRSAGAL